MAALIDAESTLASLTEAIAEGANPGVLAMHLRSLASLQWDAYAEHREDWAVIYNVWLLLAEKYRLESFWWGTPAYTNFKGRSGSVSQLLQYACFGIWCELRGCSSLASASRKWCDLELAALRGPVGPSASVVECFMANKLTPTAAIDWLNIRKKFSRGGMRRAAVHNDFWPYDVLAPELAWCKREGQNVQASSAVTTFPPFQEWPVTSVTERALTAVATSQWG